MWKDTKSYGQDLGDLIEYERGSVFGGLITIAVFFGFGYLLWNDVSTNLNDRLYSFEVRDKLMSAEECGRTEINFQAYNQSLNLMFGIDPSLPPEERAIFDPLDNDYVQIVIHQRDTTKESLDRISKPNLLKQSNRYQIKRCTEKEYELIAPTIRWAYPQALCFKDLEKINTRGNYVLESNDNLFITIVACDPRKRSTCKSREEIGLFLSESNIFVESQNNIVNPD